MFKIALNYANFDWAFVFSPTWHRYNIDVKFSTLVKYKKEFMLKQNVKKRYLTTP